ncbi:hypothetical protein WJX73_010005 [Symbiochloris irregularis]|uniref:Uncharacterized protein n=1 Tax=Symbiochloris irregularis TaxID=706552 RepID=A0AAW1NQI3_9CHLO
MMQLAATNRALPVTVPRSGKIAALPLARPSRAAFVCRAEPPKTDEVRDKDGRTEADREKIREARRKFLAGVKIPDESEATKKGIKRGEGNP